MEKLNVNSGGAAADRQNDQRAEEKHQGSAALVRRLQQTVRGAAVLNLKYRKLDSGAFFHSSVIVLLDEQGRALARVDGADTDAAAILPALATPSI